VTLTPVAAVHQPLTFAVSPPGDASRLMLLEQDGLILLLRNGVVQRTPFLDLRSLVRADGEKGLLSLAFAPDYATSGLFYVYYNDVDGNVNLVEYRRSATSQDVADPHSARTLVHLIKPTADHNGGMMQFGPDGDLYVAVGDGGADPPTVPIGIYGQTLGDLFGSILRIDPRHGDPYAIPPGNPFASAPGARPEIVAYGLRNPWRFWIDAPTDTMWIGDVGQESQEEIDQLPLDALGANFGWPCEEGTIVPPAVDRPASCATATLTPPVYAYPHSSTRCSVISGPVVRDPRLPTLAGLVLWTDLCDQHVYALDPAAPQSPRTLDLPPVQAPTSFGVDARKRVYVVTAGGELYRLDPAEAG
jgi:glucose/arabinose dehydrogenase